MAGYFKKRFRPWIKQPGQLTSLVDPDKWVMVDVEGQPLLGTAASNIVKTYNAGATTGYNETGKALEFTALDDWVDYGSTPDLHLDTFTILINCVLPTALTGATLYNTYVKSSPSSGGCLIDIYQSKVRLLKLDIALILGSATEIPKDKPVTIAVSYNSSTGRARICTNGVLESGSSAQAFNHGLVGANRYYTIDTTSAGIWKRNLLAVSPYETLSDIELISLSLNPWQVFNPLQRKIWVPVAAGGGGFKPHWALKRTKQIGLR